MRSTSAARDARCDERVHVELAPPRRGTRPPTRASPASFGTNSEQQSSNGRIDVSYVPMRLASVDDLLLVRPDQRTQHRHVDDVVDARDVLERLRRDLSEAVAGHERLRAFPPRDLGRDAHHQPPVQHDAQRRRRGDDDLLLRVPERDEVQRRRRPAATRRSFASSLAFRSLDRSVKGAEWK